MHIRFFYSLLLVSFVCLTGQAQTDSTSVKQLGEGKIKSSVIIPPATLHTANSDTLKKVAPTFHSPKKAAIYSAVLPGAGQIYNRKYWKVGALAVGAGALVYSLQFSQKNYHLYKTELIKRQGGQTDLNTDLVKYTDANLNELQDFYHRNRDLSIVGMALLYAINIIDANVDAHFFHFNINDDLSLRIRPEPMYSGFTSLPSAGMGFTLSF